MLSNGGEVAYYTVPQRTKSISYITGHFQSPPPKWPILCREGR